MSVYIPKLTGMHHAWGSGNHFMLEMDSMQFLADLFLIQVRVP